VIPSAPMASNNRQNDVNGDRSKRVACGEPFFRFSANLLRRCL
jgi:hypothetical protein